MSDTSATIENIRALRARLAINIFKTHLLGDMHVKDKHQYTLVAQILGIEDDKEFISDRRWADWCSGKDINIRPGKAKLLDKFASEKITVEDEEGSKPILPEHYFFEMIHGGLVSSMLSPTKSEHVKHVLMTRAHEYEPISLMHLHLDAIEVNAMTDDFHEVHWQEMMEISARRILELLSDYWGPRTGLIYPSFSSSLKLQWLAADESGRKQIREDYARFKPDMFEEKFNDGAYPDWNRIGVEGDVAPQHIYKTLFAIAADHDFLVEDRLYAWALSLATSALAMHALAWSDRYTTFGIHITDELLFWRAFHHLLFDHEADDIDEDYLSPVMGRCPTEWDERSLGVFKATRDKYRSVLADYSISVQDILHIAETAERVHPLVYRGR